MNNKKQKSKRTSYKKSVKLRKKKLKNSNISLYLDIYLGNNQRQYEFLGIHYNPKNIPDKRDKIRIAEEIKVKRELELICNDNGIIPSYKKKSNFVEYYEKLAESKIKTEKSWRNVIKHLKEYTKGHIQFNKITEQWLDEFKKYLLTKISRNTAHTYFSKIKASLKQAVKDNILHNNPAQNVSQISKEDIERVYLSEGEIQKLFKTTCKNNEVKLAFLFSCFTGLRLSDVINLSWGHISFDEKKMYIKQRKTKESLYLDLSQTAIDILLSKREEKIQSVSNKVFDLPCKTLITKYLKEWVKNASIEKKVTFHTSRHTFATLSLTMGVDLYTVSKLIGHKSIKNTQIYAKIVDEKKKEAINKLPYFKLEN